jgi:hypothetical protein
LFSANNDDDPLCGSLTTHVVEGDNNLTIKMYHMFSKVTVTATTAGLSGTPAIGPISTILPGYKAKLDILGAGLVKDAAENQEIGWPAHSAAVTVMSNERKVYAGGEANTYIQIPSVTIGAVLYEGLSPARFVKVLERGKRYTLTLAFKNLQFAGSNIYWKAVASGPQAPGYLTFDGVGETAHQGYQGVFFKWGSLVGISPAGDQAVVVSDVRKVYSPEYNSGSPTWTVEDISLRNVPQVTDVFSGLGLDPSVAYMTDDERNTANDYAYWNAKKGDICRYLSENGYGPGGHYRLPTGSEWGATIDVPSAVFSYGSGWVEVGPMANSVTGINVSETYVDGTLPLSFGASYIGVHFPASGVLEINWYDSDGTTCRLLGVTTTGYYWGASVSGTLPTGSYQFGLAYSLGIAHSGVSYGGNIYITVSKSGCVASSVRCVKY